MQDEDGGDLVDDGAVFGTGASRGVQVAMGFRCGETLVPEVDGELGFVTQGLRESLGLGGLRTLIPRHVEGIADDDPAAAIFADEALQGFEVLPAVGADESEDGLGGQPERVGHGHTNAAVSHVEAHEARGRSP